MKKVAISCLVDASPKFVMQCWNWLASLEALGTSQRVDVFIHHTPNVARSHLDHFKRFDVRLVEVETFGEGDAAYCNKIRQLESGELDGYDHVILSDADIFFLSCPSHLATGDVVKAKRVDKANPPEDVWRKLLTGAGLGNRIETVDVEFDPGQSAFSSSFNGGLYVIPGSVANDLTRLWIKWARYCLEKGDVLGQWRMHSDQLGFGMALLEGDFAFANLPIEENFPTHFPATNYARLKPTQIRGLHYHSKLDQHGLVRPTGVPWIDKQIAFVNEAIGTNRRKNFDNSSFWDFRYLTSPELGSGLGSRGDVMRTKDAMLRPYMKAVSTGSVIDVGCGDLEVLHTMPFKDYLGIDVSGEAIEIARSKRPDWTFKKASIAEQESGSRDYAICLDVLIHQSSQEQFDSLLNDLIRVCRKGLFVSGYGRDNPNAGIVFTHRSLPQALSQHPQISDVIEIGSYRDVNLYLALKSEGLPLSPADASIADIAFGCNETAEWPLLLDLVQLSRAELGFFPRTIIRTVEYPWFARRLVNESHARVLDIGAGVCALPLWLAREGCDVVTIDYSSNVRELATKSKWNEWGFLDYAQLDPRIKSHNMNALDYTSDEPFDVVYSVSVIEHMPAKVRRAILAKLPSLLAPGGRLFLSIDLVPGTDELWTLSEGVVVDPPGEHGTLQDILEEIERAGFRIIETALRRAISNSRTDLAFIEAVLPINASGKEPAPNLSNGPAVQSTMKSIRALLSRLTK